MPSLTALQARQTTCLPLTIALPAAPPQKAIERYLKARLFPLIARRTSLANGPQNHATSPLHQLTLPHANGIAQAAGLADTSAATPWKSSTQLARNHVTTPASQSCSTLFSPLQLPPHHLSKPKHILPPPKMLRTTFTKTAAVRPLRTAAFSTTARAMAAGDTGAPPKTGGQG